MGWLGYLRGRMGLSVSGGWGRFSKLGWICLFLNVLVVFRGVIGGGLIWMGFMFWKGLCFGMEFMLLG